MGLATLWTDLIVVFLLLMELEETNQVDFKKNNSKDTKIKVPKEHAAQDSDSSSHAREGYRMQRDYIGILRDLEEKLEKEDFYSEELKRRRGWKFLPFLKPKTYELKAKLIEESLGEWYKEPYLDVDNPSFDRDAYAELIQAIYEAMGFHERRFGVSFHNVSLF